MRMVVSSYILMAHALLTRMPGIVALAVEAFATIKDAESQDSEES